MPTAVLRFRVNLLGGLALACYSAMAILSYVQAPALWRSRPDTPRANAFFRDLAESFPPIGLHRLLEDNAAVVFSHFIPLGLATLAALVLVGVVLRRGAPADESVLRAILRWAIAFAAVSLFAFPIFTQDFWLSAAWGRMVAAAENPYHQHFTPHSLDGIPLDHFPMAMSYGPAWAIVSGAVMLLSGKSLIAAAVLFKLLLGGAWIASLVLVARIGEPRPMLERCVAVALFGWIPIGVVQTVAEGHNDIMMAVLSLLWLHLLLRGRMAAPVALAISAMSKYVTAPLALVDAIAALRLHRLSWQRFILRYVAPGLVGLALLAVFYRSFQFFDGTRLVNQWFFLMPGHAIGAIEDMLDINLTLLQYAIRIAFGVVALLALVALYRRPSYETVMKATLAIMACVTFAVVAHIWTWYLVWTIGLAALVPGWWLSRFVVGIAIFIPFTLAAWWIPSLMDHQEWAALFMYGGALAWTLVTYARAAPRAAAAPEPRRAAADAAAPHAAAPHAAEARSAADD